MNNQEDKNKSQALADTGNFQIIPESNPYQHYFSKRQNKQNQEVSGGRNAQSTNQINNRKMMPAVESANQNSL